jgi:REP element-mobilizing transposase RayT
MPQSLSAVYIHVVFSTKHRQPWLRDRTLREDTHAMLGGISKKLECAPLQVGGVEDHVHLLGRFGRIVTVSDWVKELKRVSSLWLKERDRGLSRFMWQGGYAAFSVSASRLRQVSEYIREQEKHHLKMSFQDELRLLLRRHGLTWDEEHLWE